MGTYDVAVVGGGIAGLSAAVRAAELGLKVAVFEKGADQKYLCNSRFTGGIYHVCQQLVDTPPAQLSARIATVTGGNVDAALGEAAAADFSRAVSWLRSQGVKLMKAPNDANEAALVVAPPRPMRPGITFEKGYGGDSLLTTMTAALKKHGGELFLGATVTGLVTNGDRVSGLKVRSDAGETEHQARAVVVADGGYQGDTAMIKENIGAGADRILQRNAGSGTGDGLRMAKAAGATTAGLDNGFYGHLMALDAFDIPTLWPYPCMDRPATAGIVVGPDGKRVADEGRGAVYLTNMLGKLDDPRSTLAVFDQPIWDREGKALVVPVDPWLERLGGKLFRGATLAELASNAGVDPAGLEATVTEYNAALAAGTLQQLAQPRSNAPRQAYPIEKGPFYAIRLVPGMTYTMGGIATDPWGRARRPDGSVLEGLFAAGATTGGLEGGHNFGYVGGLSKSTIFGMRAAEYIASHRAN